MEIEAASCKCLMCDYLYLSLSCVSTSRPCKEFGVVEDIRVLYHGRIVEWQFFQESVLLGGGYIV